MVFREDSRIAEEAWQCLESGKMKCPHDQDGILYLEVESVAFNTRARDTDGSTWKENKIGIVFSSDNICYWNGEDGKHHYQICGREYVSYIGSVSEFKKHFFSCALRNGYGKYRQTILLSDGAHWISDMARELFPDAQHILDLFYLKENVYDFARVKFRQNAAKYLNWAERVYKMLENGKWKEVLKELDPDENYENTVNLYGYIDNNKNSIDYPRYKEKGWFVGSGAIESGNKVVMQKRMKQSGMRWNPETAQYLSTLCSKKESGRWDKDVEDFTKKMIISRIEI